MVITYKEARQKRLIQITDWAYKSEPSKTISDEYETVAICPRCGETMKAKKRLDLTAYEWMNIYIEKMNSQVSERNFVIVENKYKKNYFAVFAKKVK